MSKAKRPKKPSENRPKTKSMFDMTPAELEALADKAIAQGRPPIMGTLMVRLTEMRWFALSESCPNCGNPTLQLGKHMLSGTYGGTIKCFSEGCEHRESAYGFLGRTMIKVEPMPLPAVQVYDKTAAEEDKE